VLTGSNFIGPRESRAGAVSFRAQDPSTGEEPNPRKIWRLVDGRLTNEAL
jgi:hypothetical protein